MEFGQTNLAKDRPNMVLLVAQIKKNGEKSFCTDEMLKVSLCPPPPPLRG